MKHHEKYKTKDCIPADLAHSELPGMTWSGDNIPSRDNPVGGLTCWGVTIPALASVQGASAPADGSPNRSRSDASRGGRLGRPQSFIAKLEGEERRLDVIELLEVCAAIGVSAVDVVAALEGLPSVATLGALR